MIEPLHDFFLAEVIEDDTGVVKTEDVRDTKNKGKVLAVGPGRITPYGKMIAPVVKKGDIVFWEEKAEADTPNSLQKKNQVLVKSSQVIARETSK